MTRPTIRDITRKGHTYEYEDGRHVPGERSLVLAIVNQAIIDYYILVRAGQIRFGEIQPTATTYKVCQNTSIRPDEVNSLRQFVMRGQCQAVLDLAMADYDAGRLLQKLIRLEKSRDYQKLFAQGVKKVLHCNGDGVGCGEMGGAN